MRILQLHRKTTPCTGARDNDFAKNKYMLEIAIILPIHFPLCRHASISYFLLIVGKSADLPLRVSMFQLLLLLCNKTVLKSIKERVIFVAQ